MFEDISDPSRNAPPRTFMWDSLSYVVPADSFEASWNARLWSGILCAAIALNAVAEYRHPPILLLVRDALLVGVFAVVWIFRSRAVAALACVLTPLLLLVPETTPNHYSVAAARHAFKFFLFVLLVALYLVWACIRYQRFKREEAALTPDSAGGVRPT